MTDDILVRFWENVVGRVHGQMQFRFLLQPTVAAIYAVRDGLKDARANRTAYLWALFAGSAAGRGGLLREGAAAVGQVMLMGVVMELIYQLYVLRWIYPLELVFIVVLLAFVPYLLLRGPANRIARLILARRRQKSDRDSLPLA